MSQYTQKESGGLFELTDAARAELIDSKYYNEDLSPTSISQRTWTTYTITNLWIGMSICIPSLSLSSALITMGVSPWLAVLNVALGNLIVLIPIQLNSHAGTKYGLPFPVFARLTFGGIGAHIPALLRGLVACGWTAVQAWVGGGAVAAIIGCFIVKFTDPTWQMTIFGNPVSIATLVGFLIFMIFIGCVAYNGSEGIKWVQNIGGPLLVVVMIALLVWSISTASSAGFGFLDVMNQGNDAVLIEQFGGFWYVYLAGLTGNIAFWATMALSIPDFSRYAKSQKSQFRGQLYGMPVPMFGCAFIGAFFAMATKLAYGTAMFDPTGVFYYVENKFLIIVCAVGVAAATITTCVAANVVAPANGFSNLAPTKISYKVGVIITCIIAICMQPWWIYGSGAAYVFTWLNNYGTVLAPVAAIFIADYYVCKQRRVDVASLYSGPNGRYWYSSGFNIPAVIAWIAAFIIPLLGNTLFLYDPAADVTRGPNVIQWLAANGYIVSFVIGFGVYVLLMKGKTASFLTAEEEIALTERR